MNVSTMSLQEIFDHVARHLLAQKVKAMDLKYHCKYRTSRGDGSVLKCAVGCLIDDADYSPDLEGRSVDNPKILEALGYLIDPLSIVLLEKLQGVHDHWDTTLWKERLSEVATIFHLDLSVLS